MDDRHHRILEVSIKWTEVAGAHRRSHPDLWQLCEDFASLHGEAAEQVARSVANATSSSEADETLMLLVIHGMNIYRMAVGLVVEGEFDVALYFFRALFDVGPLIYGTQHPDLVEEGKALSAAEARIRFVKGLREDGHESEADWMDKLWRDREYALMQEMAHLNRAHLAQLIRPTATHRELTLGPRYDDEQCTALLRGILQFESRTLIFIHGTCHKWVGEEWSKRWEAAMLRYAT